jgi:tetratricopeptide (TPR) repeat protein
MFPAHAEPAQLAATALALQSRWPEVPSAAAQWRRRLGPDTLPADVLEATAHLQLGRPDRAVETLKHCADLSPQQVTQPLQTQAIVMLADSLVRTGRAGNARMLLASRLEHSAVLRKVWRELAVTQITDTVHASVWLHHLSSRIPADALGERHELAMHWLEWASRANYSYGLVLARAYVRHTIADTRRLSAHDVDGLLTAAELAEALHDVALSEEIYREALSLDPRNAQAANNLAMLLLDRPGDGGEALQLAQAAVDAGRGLLSRP